MCPAIYGAAGNYARRKAISGPEKGDDSKAGRVQSQNKEKGEMEVRELNYLLMPLMRALQWAWLELEDAPCVT